MVIGRAYEEPAICEIIELVPQEIRKTLTVEQRVAIAEALRSSRRRHSLDIRIPVPLGFTQLYFVLQLGKDLRRQTLDCLVDRRVRASQWVNALAVGIGAILLLFFGLGLLYVLKSKIGIDLLPHSHATDILRSVGIR